MTSEDKSGLLSRRAMTIAAESLGAFRVLMVHGARQSGKTTLARQLGQELGATHVSLDNEDDRAVAAADGRTFLEALGSR